MEIIFCIFVIYLIFIHLKLNKIEASFELLKKQLDLKSNQSNINDDECFEINYESDNPLSIDANSDASDSDAEQKIEIHAVASDFEDECSVSDNSKNKNLQKIFLENIFNKIGAVALIIAFIFFFKLVSPFIVFTPIIKTVLGYLIGFSGFGAYLFMHKKEKYRKYSEVLLGVSFSAMYISTFAAYAIFNLFSTIVVCCIAGLITILTYVIADRMESLSSLVFGLLGGYLTSIYIAKTFDLAFPFLLFINLISLTYTLKNRKFSKLNSINLSITSLFYIIAFLLDNQYSVYYAYALWLMYVVYDILRSKCQLKDNVTIWLNFSILTLVTLITKDNTYGNLFLVFGGAYLVLSIISRHLNDNLYKCYDPCLLLYIWLHIFLSCNESNYVYVYSVVAFIITAIIYLLNADHVKNAILVFYSTVFAAVFFATLNGQYILTEKYNYILNPRLLQFAVPSLSTLGALYICKDRYVKFAQYLKFEIITLLYTYIYAEMNSIISQKYDNSKDLLFIQLIYNTILGFIWSLNLKNIVNTNSIKLFNFVSYVLLFIGTIILVFSCNICNADILSNLNLNCLAYFVAIASYIYFAKITKKDLFKYIAVFLGFWFCHNEVSIIYNYIDKYEYIITLSWLFYTAIISIVGIIKHKNVLINSSIMLILISILRIFLVDLEGVNSFYKLIAFFALGVLLMIISFIYTKANRD